jgi:pimeloyl-ACP methyl ester carboxylesterase
MTEDYANLIKQFMKKLDIVHPMIIGHSFGGKIAIQLATSQQLHKMVLINSACFMKQRKRWRDYFKVLPRKLAKKILELMIPQTLSKKIIEFFKKRMGSSDYRNASGIMREILIKIVNEDLRNCLPMIKTKTLLIWGEHDQETPVYTGKLMEKLIPDAKLVILKNAGHFSYLDQFRQFIKHLDQFFQEDVELEHH